MDYSNCNTMQYYFVPVEIVYKIHFSNCLAGSFEPVKYFSLYDVFTVMAKLPG